MKRFIVFGLSLLLFGTAVRPISADPLDDVFGTVTPPAGTGGKSFAEGLIPFLNRGLRLFFIIAGLYAFLNLILAGFEFINARGDAKKIESAWYKIWQSIVGLLIIVASFVIAALIGLIIFGDPMYILNPKITGADV
jgi:hypothetical protein